MRRCRENLEDLYEVLQMYNDVTQRLEVSHERLQQEVVRLTGQLEQKNRELEMKKRLAALGEMAAGIAHEIRNPLGGIQLYASTLASEVADRPLAAELVKKISAGVKGLNELVCDMLAFTGNMNLNRREEDLGEIVSGAIELARPTLLQHGIEVATSGADGANGERRWAVVGAGGFESGVERGGCDWGGGAEGWADCDCCEGRRRREDGDFD